MARLDYYATLGIGPDATDEDVKKAYRKLALTFHPDRNQGNPQAESKIREINAAYEILGNPESRKSYERLRFGGYGQKADGYEPFTEETPDPAVVFRDMTRKLEDEARKEMFSALIRDKARVKQELGVIRERVVAEQGYDTFRQDWVIRRAKEVVQEFVSLEVQTRRERLLDVALQMLLSQNVARDSDEQEVKALQKELEAIYDEGWVAGYVQACELFYARR